MYIRVFIILFFGFSFTNLLSQKSIIDEQKKMLSVLTGESKYREDILKTRYTKEERKIVTSYLSDKIKNLSLEVKEHVYKFKNLDPEKLPEFFEGRNVYTILPATTKSSEYIILGAHFDSVRDCPGANDNATGVTLAYSVVKMLQLIKKRNKNIMLVFFDQEERGLIGSRAFAEFIKEKGLNIHSVHTVDQMGWDKDGDQAIELELPTAVLQEKYTVQAKKLNIPVFVTEVSSTDHQAFREIGFNAIGITEEYVHEDTTPFYHSSRDTYQTVNFKYLASSTQLVFKVLEDLVKTDN